MTLDKVDRFNASTILAEIEADVKELENELGGFLENANEPDTVHEEIPLMFVIHDDLNHLIERLNRAQRQLGDSR